MDRYFARSASDNTDDWPFWFVADNHKGGLNVTYKAACLASLPFRFGAVFTDRTYAEKIARMANLVYAKGTHSQ